MEANTHFPDPSQVREELIQRYPTKVAKKRAKSIIVNDPQIIPEVQANVRTVPGIITQRGCSYAGCKGVVLGPTRDIVNIVHGPIGCSFYAWMTRRNQTRTESLMDANFIPYCFSTDMQEENIVFGGEKKLKQAIQEAYDLFHPKSIAIFSTCPVGLIGDDVHAASREMKEKLGDCNVFGFSCEGYRGVSQSAGHHIANNGVFKHMVGRDNTPSEGKFKLNLLGEYNIGGDAFEIERIFEKAGLTLVSSFSGNSTVKQLENSHTADLNVIQCHRSINYMGDMMETKYGIPWMKVSFVGAESSAKSLRKIAEYFDDEELKARVEAVIAEEMPKVKAIIDEILPRTTGKTAMLFVGGSRAHHYQDLFTELGMTTVAAGYEFAHRDDYEGRDVLPNIKIDADSKNIEELKVLPDPELYNPRKTEAELAALKEKGLEINGYEGMMKQMTKKSLVVDDLSHYESEKLIEIYKPDIFCAGIKEKYVVQKMGVPLKQLHSYDYGGPYTGFEGAVNFYKDIDRMVNNPVWKLIKAPWEKAGNGAALEATYVTQ
ncbi:nitrogenase molybdenum-iron protein alpha chain [Chlorobium sp. BLA1]|uniref:nitrogenase molybdenum-iron protein alpha chain n=1 Tax=Candidatus Chlorobium masyuteum TaxID=2716876 RepID=UPI0014217179|nr:nitrogenase molybdenum-iron protein alpha chain [Candidatus Chlorobium masyuteum]NHQ60217.1 nitrogenase molybdenum-iron protein alpha chain [Candidatus Chlorobium masyuteum]NTU44523.1 nitrogenase molybdenum-iron protein alpha chain [Chlorobiaceae bacterium]